MRRWIATLLLFPAVCPAQSYRWPVDLPPEITSSFGEFRDGRFHAGIDIRTGGNRPVHAIEDGNIARIRCGPSGYGKALYQQLEDGRLAVYAHLDAFSGAIDEYVRAAQHAARSYTVELTPPIEMFPVKRGDRIATSGQSGTTAPHLHFELRQPEDQPVDPFHAGLTWNDTTRPLARQLLLMPLDPESRVEGDLIPRAFPLKHLGNGRYEAAPVSATGRIAVGLELIDPAPGGAKLGVQSLSLRQEGVEKFRIDSDKIRYDDIGDGAVAYHPFLRDTGRFLLLWRWPGNECGFYAHAPGDGALHVSSETASGLEVHIADVGGNEATVRIPIQAQPFQEAAPPALTTLGTGTWRFDFFGQMLLVTTTFSQAEAEAPQVMLDGQEGSSTLPVIRVDARTFRAAFQPKEAGQFRVRVTHPRVAREEDMVSVFLRGGAGHSVTQGEVAAAVEGGAPYGMLPLQATETAPPAPGALRAYGKAYALWPEEVALDSPITLTFPLPEDASNSPRLSVYRKRGGGWAREESIVQDGRLVVKTSRLGTFMAMEDVQSPKLSEVLPAEDYKATSKRPYIKMRLGDAGSGIAKYEVICGEQWLLAEYDPIRGTLEWLRDEDLPSGQQTIHIEVVDGAGNATTLSRKVSIP